MWQHLKKNSTTQQATSFERCWFAAKVVPGAQLSSEVPICCKICRISTPGPLPQQSGPLPMIYCVLYISRSSTCTVQYMLSWRVVAALQIRERDRVRPQPGGAAAGRRCGRLRLHQRQLLRRLQEAERLHCHTGQAAHTDMSSSIYFYFFIIQLNDGYKWRVKKCQKVLKYATAKLYRKFWV